MKKVLLTIGTSLFLTTNLLAATSVIDENSVLEISAGGRYIVLAENKVEKNGTILATGNSVIDTRGLIDNKGKILLNDITDGQNIKLKLGSEGIVEINNYLSGDNIPKVGTIETINGGTKQAIDTNLPNETIVIENCEVGANTSLITEQKGEEAIFDFKKTDVSGTLETDRNMVFD